MEKERDGEQSVLADLEQKAWILHKKGAGPAPLIKLVSKSVQADVTTASNVFGVVPDGMAGFLTIPGLAAGNYYLNATYSCSAAQTDGLVIVSFQFVVNATPVPISRSSVTLNGDNNPDSGALSIVVNIPNPGSSVSLEWRRVGVGVAQILANSADQHATLSIIQTQ